MHVETQDCPLSAIRPRFSIGDAKAEADYKGGDCKGSKRLYHRRDEPLAHRRMYNFVAP